MQEQKNGAGSNAENEGASAQEPVIPIHEAMRRADAPSACQALAEAIDPERVSQEAWIGWEAAFRENEHKVFVGWLDWAGARREGRRAQMPAEEALRSLAQAIGREGERGAVARKRFAATFGRMKLAKLEKIPRALLVEKTAISTKSAALAWCDAAVELASRAEPGPAGKALSAWRKETLRHWAVSAQRRAGAGVVVAFVAEKLIEAFGAFSRLGGMRPQEALALAKDALESIDGSWGRDAGSWAKGASLGNGLRHGGQEGLRFCIEIQRIAGQEPRPRDWAAAFGVGASSGELARRAVEQGFVDDEMAERALAFKGLGPGARATLEELALRKALAQEAAGQPKPKDPKKANAAAAGGAGEAGPGQPARAKRRL
jgi:hypothetical protein